MFKIINKIFFYFENFIIIVKKFYFFYLKPFYKYYLRKYFVSLGVLIFFLFWWVLPTVYKEKIKVGISIFSIYIYNLTEIKRNVFCFIFSVLCVVLLVLVVNSYVISFKKLLLCVFFCFFVFYIGGGALAAYIFTKQNKTMSDKHQHLLYHYPFLKSFLLTYEYFFNSQSGIVCNFISTKIFWYLENIHPLISYFFKFKVTGFRFFCYSVASWINIVIFLNVVPSFIGEGLDPSYYFTVFSWCCVSEQHQVAFFRFFRDVTNKSQAFKVSVWEFEIIRTKHIFDSLVDAIMLDIRGLDILRIIPLNTNLHVFNWLTDKTRFFFDSITYQRVNSFFLLK